MLVIVLTTAEGQEMEKEWHVGDALPEHPAREKLCRFPYILIQADGHELEYVGRMFADNEGKDISIPYPLEKRIVRWYGDIARTILLNL